MYQPKPLISYDVAAKFSVKKVIQETIFANYANGLVDGLAK